MKKSLISVITLISLFAPIALYSQILDDSEREGSSQSFFPLVGYTSDSGFVGGVVYQRINYADSRRPFLSNLVVDVIGSTKGIWIGRFDFEQIETFGRPIRSRSLLELERNPIRNFFGIGNDTDFSEDDYQGGLFYLNQRHALLSFEGRKPVISFTNEHALEGVLRIKGSYTSVSDRGADTEFVRNPPEHRDDGWVNTIGIGMILDSRDSEFDPGGGQVTEIGYDISSSLIGSDYTFHNFFANWRGFIFVTENTILAQRIALNHTIGDPPFWELPSLGRSKALRGFSLDRFKGDSSVLSMTELRQWLFSFFDGEIRIGAQLFYDTGRVFSEYDSDEIFSEWKNTWGGGGAMSLSQDVIFRGEIGFSGEGYRIYAGVGYAF